MKYSDFSPRRTPSASIPMAASEQHQAPGSPPSLSPRRHATDDAGTISQIEKHASDAMKSAAQSCSAPEPSRDPIAASSNRMDSARPGCGVGGADVGKGQHFLQRIDHRDHVRLALYSTSSASSAIDAPAATADIDASVSAALTRQIAA